MHSEISPLQNSQIKMQLK